MKKNLVILITLSTILLVTLACAAVAPTPEPTAAPIPVPTEEPTAVPPTESVSEPEVDVETSSETLSDGSTKFTDNQGGYQITFPDNWVIPDYDDGDFNAALDLTGEANPDISNEMIEISKGMLTESTRLFAMNTNEGHYSEQMMTVAFSMLNEELNGYALDFLVDMSAQALPQQLPNIEVLSSRVEKNAAGTDIGIIEVLLPINDPLGNTISVYERMFFVQNSDDVTTMMVFATDNSILSTTAEHFDQIQDFIVLVP